MQPTKIAVLAVLAVAASAVSAQTVKVGFITSYSGLQGEIGPYMERGVRLYLKLHGKELPPGVKIELVTRDDTGANPDKARQLAQELIVREKVDLLAGVIFTPNALAIAPLATDAKVPFVVMNAATSMITTRSPYLVRTSFTMWQSDYPLGQWAAKKYKTAYTLVSDYGPGIDSEQAFTTGYTAGGGRIVGAVRAPLQNQDWSVYMQRVRDARPEALLVMVPAGKMSTAVMKAFEDVGLKKAGVRLLGAAGLTVDDELAAMGEVALGTTTVFHWSLAADRPANKAFIAAWKEEYGAHSVPNMYSVGSWDGAAMIFEAVKLQKGKLDPERTLEIFKHWKNPDSPRGAISIDPETRDIVQPEYLREVRKVNGGFANVEIETLSTAQKDPWKELQKKK